MEIKLLSFYTKGIKFLYMLLLSTCIFTWQACKKDGQEPRQKQSFPASNFIVSSKDVFSTIIVVNVKLLDSVIKYEYKFFDDQNKELTLTLPNTSSGKFEVPVPKSGTYTVQLTTTFKSGDISILKKTVQVIKQKQTFPADNFNVSNKDAFSGIIAVNVKLVDSVIKYEYKFFDDQNKELTLTLPNTSSGKFEVPVSTSGSYTVQLTTIYKAGDTTILKKPVQVDKYKVAISKFIINTIGGLPLGTTSWDADGSTADLELEYNVWITSPNSFVGGEVLQAKELKNTPLPAEMSDPTKINVLDNMLSKDLTITIWDKDTSPEIDGSGTVDYKMYQTYAIRLADMLRSRLGVFSLLNKEGYNVVVLLDWTRI